MSIFFIENNLFVHKKSNNSIIDSQSSSSSKYIEVLDYNDYEKTKININIINEARCFGYFKYETFDGFECFSLEILNFNELFSTLGSVVIYIEENRLIFLVSQKSLVSSIINELLQSITNITLGKVIYSFFEKVIKSYPEVADRIEKEIMDLEHEIIINKGKNSIYDIIRIRKELLVLKRYYEQALFALDIINSNDNNFLDSNDIKAFNGLSNILDRKFQNILNLREDLVHVRESYEAEFDISLNMTMRFFTAITAIFLPLTLAVGWYGMNFDMPEFNSEYSYLIFIIISFSFSLLSIYYFKKNNWF